MEINSNIINKNSSIFIATFSAWKNGHRLPTNGMVEPLLSFFTPKIRSVLLIDQPHPVSDTINPIVEIHQRRKALKTFNISFYCYLPIYLLCLIPSKNHTRLSYKIRDFFSVIYVALTQKYTAELFIGLEGINALAGLVLKKIGKVKTVIYYVSDYSPTRYGDTLFNKLYIWLDFFCVKHCDFTWDVSPAMKEARLQYGLSPNDAKRIIHVPNGLFPSQIAPLPISQRVRDRILFVGIFDPELGIDLLINSLKLIKSKRPKATLHVIGGMDEEIVKMKELAAKLGIEKSITFYGYKPSNEVMTTIVKKCYIGVAPYRSYKSSRRRYGDSGKIRLYLGCGLPIVSTYLLWHTKYAIRMGAGLRTKDTVKDLTKNILTLLEDDDLYKKCSKKAIELSKQNVWENSYGNALLDMQKYREHL
jgi:glycosyltransferase involved in cell wall biosynthesis